MRHRRRILVPIGNPLGPLHQHPGFSEPRIAWRDGATNSRDPGRRKACGFVPCSRAPAPARTSSSPPRCCLRLGIFTDSVGHHDKLRLGAPAEPMERATSTPKSISAGTAVGTSRWLWLPRLAGRPHVPDLIAHCARPSFEERDPRLRIAWRGGPFPRANTLAPRARRNSSKSLYDQDRDEWAGYLDREGVWWPASVTTEEGSGR